MQVDPIHQFEIKDFFPVFHIAGYECLVVLPRLAIDGS